MKNPSRGQSTEICFRCKIAKRQTKSYCKNCQRVLSVESNKRCRLQNPKKKQQHNKKYEAKNPTWRIIQSEKYYARTADYHKKLMKAWRKNNPDKCLVYAHNRRAREKGAKGKLLLSEWNNLKMYYNNICLGCSQPKRLTIDHVIPLIRGGSNHVSNIQPLCGQCNFRKGRKIIDYRPPKN